MKSNPSKQFPLKTITSPNNPLNTHNLPNTIFPHIPAKSIQLTLLLRKAFDSQQPESLRPTSMSMSIAIEMPTKGGGGKVMKENNEQI
eukprot:150713-Amorphochlora_amoeboformis.AAC.1